MVFVYTNLSVLGIELEEICLSLVEHPVRCDYFYVKMRSLSCGITICCASTVCCVMLLFSFSLFIIPVFCLFLLDIFFLLQLLFTAIYLLLKHILAEFSIEYAHDIRNFYKLQKSRKSAYLQIPGFYSYI